MTITANFLDAVGTAAQGSAGPLAIPWPVPGNPGGFASFASFPEWQAFVLNLGLRAGIPDIVTAKFERAQKLYILAWIDFDLIKAGELCARVDPHGPVRPESEGKIRQHDVRPSHALHAEARRPHR
jgi:hypothetical protein